MQARPDSEHTHSAETRSDRHCARPNFFFGEKSFTVKNKVTKVPSVCLCGPLRRRTSASSKIPSSALTPHGQKISAMIWACCRLISLSLCLAFWIHASTSRLVASLAFSLSVAGQLQTNLSTVIQNILPTMCMLVFRILASGRDRRARY